MRNPFAGVSYVATDADRRAVQISLVLLCHNRKLFDIGYSVYMAKSSKQSLSEKDATQVAKALQILFATDYISKKKLYWQNFLRGISFSVGSIIGATVGIALIIWVLSLFKTVPLIGPLIRSANHTIQRNK